MRNKLNGNKVVVGNCCVNKFPLGLDRLNDTSLAFSALAKKRVNASLIRVAHGLGHINDWEYKFMMDVWRKRVLSPKQQIKRRDIAEKMFGGMAVKHKEKTLYERLFKREEVPLL